MKKLYLLVIFGVMIFGNGKGQNLIAVQNGGAPGFYSTLDSAITFAQNGDTIYLPGGLINFSKQIDKRLHIFGVGHNPDSTKVTNITKLMGQIILLTGADYGTLSGVYNTSPILFQGQICVSHYTINRCNLPSLVLNQGNNCCSSENLFTENIISGELKCCGNGSNSFFNNIISGFCYCSGSSIFRNNIFLNFNDGSGYYWPPTLNGSGGLFENNVFNSPNYNTYNGGGALQNSVFNNNLFVENWSGYCYGSSCLSSNNIVNQISGSIFVNQTANYFDYKQDYHLKPDSPGKNAGRDGTDIGIYGGAYPWKDGSIPSNPHFQKAQISPTTDTNGNLNVKIKVAAQEH